MAPSILDRLPAALATTAGEHLAPSERLLAATYLLEIRDPGNVRWHRIAAERQSLVPGRALVVTDKRVLLLDDPEDKATATAGAQFVAAECPIGDILAMELRSYLLDCALTLVVAAPGGARRLTIGYNGVHEPDVLATVRSIRAACDAVRAPVQRGADAEVQDSVLEALDHRHRYFVQKFLGHGEPVLHLVAPEAGSRLAKHGLFRREVPGRMLVETDSVVLVVRDVPRRRRQRAANGCDAWLLPLADLTGVAVEPAHRGTAVVLDMGRSALHYSVSLAASPAMTGDLTALAAALQSVASRTGA